MIIGIPKEIGNHEYRVGIDPANVALLVERGHRVLVERHAGVNAGFADDQYNQAGASVIENTDDLWADAQMIVKVHRPVEAEFRHFRKNLIVMAYLHLAADTALTRALEREGVTGVAYETIQHADNSLPVLKPMSDIAGRMAVQYGAHYLEKMHGGAGVLLGGIPGVRRAKVTIIGAGSVGQNAARIAAGMGAEVYLLDVNLNRLERLDYLFQGRVQTLFSTPGNIAEAVVESNLVIGAVLIVGAKAPHLVTEEMVKSMQQGSVIIDTSIDQGGIVETARATTHDQPTYARHDVVHYCVENITSAVSQTATLAMTNAGVRYIKAIADKGITEAVMDDPSLFMGVNTFDGHVTYEAVAEACGLEYRPLSVLL